jgi:hypothetical protein
LSIKFQEKWQVVFWISRFWRNSPVETSCHELTTKGGMFTTWLFVLIPTDLALSASFLRGVANSESISLRWQETAIVEEHELNRTIQWQSLESLLETGRNRFWLIRPKPRTIQAAGSNV